MTQIYAIHLLGVVEQIRISFDYGADCLSGAKYRLDIHTGRRKQAGLCNKVQVSSFDRRTLFTAPI